MQSLRQYRAIRSAVAAQVETGKVVNLSNEKTSVLGDNSSQETRTATADLNDVKDEGGDIIVGWDSPQGILCPISGSIVQSGADH